MIVMIQQMTLVFNYCSIIMEHKHEKQMLLSTYLITFEGFYLENGNK